MKKIKHINKKGVAIFMVLFIMMFLGILLVAFFTRSQDAQRTAHRFYTSEMARQLAAAAQEEAFIYLYNQTDNPEAKESSQVSDLFNKIVTRNSSIDYGTTFDNSKGYTLDVPITKAIDNRLDVDAKIGIVDFRTNDLRGIDFYEDSESKIYEGVGTLEITVTVKAKDKYKNVFPGSCSMARQHDYKVMLLREGEKYKNSKNSYSNGYVLDYVLFIRKGQKKYESTDTSSINTEKGQTLIIKAEANGKLGKVNLGSGGGKYQYLNISSDTLDLIKFEDGSLSTVPKKIVEYKDGDVDSFYPSLIKQLKTKGVKSVSGYKAKFYHCKLPLMDEYYIGQEMNLHRSTAVSFAHDKGKKISYLKGGIIIEPIDRIGEILKSDLRKQYFDYGYFQLDLKECVADIKDYGTINLYDYNKDKLQELMEAKLPVWDYDEYKKKYGHDSYLDIIKLDVIKNKLYSSHPELFSKINDDYTFGKGTNEEHIKNENCFFRFSDEVGGVQPNQTPENSKYPYAHHNLWNKKQLTLEEFNALNIYDRVNNILCLRGVVHLNASIVLGSDDPNKVLTVKGSGVLIARGITINCGIKKEKDNAICVLFSRNKDMTINTDQEIQAALICMGQSSDSNLYVNKCLKLKGSIAADCINLNNWYEGKHEVVYDSVLAPSLDVYNVIINKSTTFERVIEKE